ncbi:unnamed protein product, partial [marine sediment metagenome]
LPNIDRDRKSKRRKYFVALCYTINSRLYKEEIYYKISLKGTSKTKTSKEKNSSKIA